MNPIVGDWQFPNNNKMTFAENGDVSLCGWKVACWKEIQQGQYVIAYLRGYFDGASDSLEILPNGRILNGLASGFETRQIERVNGDNDPECVVGTWDFKNGNVLQFLDDGWVESCSERIGLWVRTGPNVFSLVYLRGYFGGASDPLELCNEGETLKCLLDGREPLELERAACNPNSPTCKFDDAILRLGTVEFEVSLGPAGSSRSADVRFVEFPEEFPDDRLNEIAVILTNRTAPALVADATVNRLEGKQGFWLRVSNSVPATSSRDEREASFSGTVSFNWLSVLSCSERHALSNGSAYAVRSGIIAPEPLEKHSAHEWPAYPDLFGDAFTDCEAPLLFMTPTHGDGFSGPLGEHVSAVNRAVVSSQTGISKLSTWNADSCSGYATFFWLAIAKTKRLRRPTNANEGFAINCGVSRKPQQFARTATYNDWQNLHRIYEPPFEEPPHTFVTASGAAVEGHHSSVVGLAFHQEVDCGNVKGRSCDPNAGQAGFHWIAIGSQHE